MGERENAESFDIVLHVQDSSAQLGLIHVRFSLEQSASQRLLEEIEI
jgi:hypothetical protein